MSADIFASQAGDEDLLAAIYDLEHDDVVEDLPFWREQVRLGGGRVLDLGCGSGRLFGALLGGRCQPRGGHRRFSGAPATGGGTNRERPDPCSGRG